MKNSKTLELLRGDNQYFGAFIQTFVEVAQRSRLTDQKQTRISKEELVKQVIRGNAGGSIQDVKDYYEDSVGDIGKLVQIVNHSNHLKTHLKFFKQIGQSQIVQLSKIEQLQSYLETVKSKGQAAPVIEDDFMVRCNYQEVVESLLKVIFRKCENKMNAVWLYGDPDRGKTTIAKMLEQIFITERFQESPSQFQITTGRIEKKPSIVIMNEINHRQFFSKNNIAAMKSFLEGEGYPVNRKFEDPEIKYQGCQVFITSNSLPFDRIPMIDKEAFLTRVTLIELHKDIREVGKPFPFTTAQLAQYFLKRLQIDGDVPGEAGQTCEDTTVDNGEDEGGTQ
ncbi:hypothetical protein OXYTRIMIC_111 [Oxytricha trifallax]|uniref:NrS-1 polymerase-like helicase domain-containing protein n=1 Tax=Oxytricha trifallax TaxID=1172189 RepID=A0A073HYS6_9SPIT|nr:hypothetical protein OXYTRIMIC_111 [Oxytricha trifallax]